MVDSKHVEGNCLPLCFSSFELLNQIFRVTNQPHKYDIMNEDISFLEMDDEKDDQSWN